MNCKYTSTSTSIPKSWSIYQLSLDLSKKLSYEGLHKNGNCELLLLDLFDLKFKKLKFYLILYLLLVYLNLSSPCIYKADGYFIYPKTV